MFAKIVAKIDKFLYKYIGIVTPIRRAYWRRQARGIQVELDYQHQNRDFYNRVYNDNKTTKDALRLLKEVYKD